MYKFFQGVHDNRSVVSAYKNYGSNNDCILVNGSRWSVGLLYYLKDLPKCFIKLNDININSPEIIAAKKKEETFWLMINTSGRKKEEIKDILDNFKSSDWKITSFGPVGYPVYKITPE